MKQFLFNKTGWIYALILSLAFIFSVMPLAHGGLFRTLDDVQVVRIDVMHQELASGQFPVRYVNEFGNGGGYWLFNFYSPLAYYIGAIFVYIGIPLVKATKLVFFFSYLVGGFGCFFFIKKYTDRLIAVIGTILLLTSTYLAYDVYYRGDLAETMGFMLLPWLLFFFIRLLEKQTIREAIYFAIFFALTILSHTIIAFEAGIIITIVMLFPPYRKKRFLFVIAGLLFGICLSAFFFLPSVFEEQYIIYRQVSFVTTGYLVNFLNPLQVAGILPISWNIRPPLLGLGIFIGAIVSVYVMFSKKRKNTKSVVIPYVVLLIGFICSMVLIWNISKPLWDNVIYLRYTQYPYRFLALATICGIGLCCLWLSSISSNRVKILLGILLILPAITLQHAYLSPTQFEYVSVYSADDTCATTTWDQEDLPKWVKKCLPKKNPPALATTLTKGVNIQQVISQSNGRNIQFSVAGSGGVVDIAKYYFPGWQAKIDGKDVAIAPYSRFGIIQIRIPSGIHHVVISITDTPVRLFTNILSLVSWVGVVMFLTLVWYNKKDENFGNRWRWLYR